MRFILLFVILPIILLMNGCRLVIAEQGSAASSGALTAKTVLINVGAMCDYSGSVWVLPRYFPPVWPLDMFVGCQALDFHSDPRVDVVWEGSTLAIRHDLFIHPIAKRYRCYGRTVIFQERDPNSPTMTVSHPSERLVGASGSSTYVCVPPIRPMFASYPKASLEM